MNPMIVNQNIKGVNILNANSNQQEAGPNNQTLQNNEIKTG